MPCSGTVYSYAQLEGLWINAGGSAALAPTMAAVALAESGGCSTALNATDNGGTQSSFGLWQISTGTHTAPSSSWSSGPANAQLAVQKYASQGLAAWGTYTSGAYKAFMSGATTPDLSAAGGASGASATLTAADVSAATAAGAKANPDCLLGFGGVAGTSWWNDIFGQGGNLGAICLVSKANMRAVIGGVVLLNAGVVMLVGSVILAAYGLKASGAAKHAGGALEATGAAVAIIPGAELAGAALAASGQRTARAGQQGASQRALARHARRNPPPPKASPAGPQGRHARTGPNAPAIGKHSGKGP